MGKKTKMKGQGASPASPSGLSEEAAQELAELNATGTKLFAAREYIKALEVYDKGLKLVGEESAERADIHSNKAACYIQMKRFKEAVRECTSALNANSGFAKALQRRSRAYEQQGLYKQALSDIQQLNRGDAASDDTRESEKRLKDVLSGRRPGAANGSAAHGVGRTGARWPQALYFAVKCTLDGESRLVHVTHATTYAELVELVKNKFPAAGPVVLKYRDREGDLVTIAEKADVSAAIAEVVTTYEKQLAASHGPRLPPHLPTIKVQLVRVASEAEVPSPPEDEKQQFVAARNALAQARALRAQELRKREGQEEAVYEIDDWLVDFANLFRDNLGIDPDRHVEMHNLGVEKCQKALEAAIHSEKALPIFEEAAEKFKEVTCVGLLNWGNVHLCVGHKLAGEAALKQKAASEVEGDILGWFDKAEDRYQQALGFKSDFYDGILALAQLEFERAKIKVGLLIEPPIEGASGDASGATDDHQDQAESAAAALNEAMKKALSKVDGAKVSQVKPLVDKCWELYQKGVQLGEQLDKQREKDKEKNKNDKGAESAAKSANPPDGADEPGLQTHALVMWGNVQFEYSQILAVAGQEWNPVLDDAVKKFTEAGCNEKDVNQALRSHIRAEELDIKEVPTKPAEDSGDGGSGVKGLPPLTQKKPEK